MTAKDEVLKRYPQAKCIRYVGKFKVFQETGWLTLSEAKSTEKKAWEDAWAAIKRSEQSSVPMPSNILREKAESEIEFLRHSLDAVELWLRTLDSFCESPHPATALVSSSLSGEQQAVVLFLARMKLAEIAVEAAREREKRG